MLEGIYLVCSNKSQWQSGCSSLGQQMSKLEMLHVASCKPVTGESGRDGSKTSFLRDQFTATEITIPRHHISCALRIQANTIMCINTSNGLPMEKAVRGWEWEQKGNIQSSHS